LDSRTHVLARVFRGDGDNRRFGGVWSCYIYPGAGQLGWKVAELQVSEPRQEWIAQAFT
jgi:hypothetical protein